MAVLDAATGVFGRGPSLSVTVGPAVGSIAHVHSHSFTWPGSRARFHSVALRARAINSSRHVGSMAAWGKSNACRQQGGGALPSYWHGDWIDAGDDAYKPDDDKYWHLESGGQWTDGKGASSWEHQPWPSQDWNQGPWRLDDSQVNKGIKSTHPFPLSQLAGLRREVADRGRSMYSFPVSQLEGLRREVADSVSTRRASRLAPLRLVSFLPHHVRTVRCGTGAGREG